MIVVPRINTPIPFKDIPGVVRASIAKEVGSEPSSQAVANLSALIALEVARGKAVQNHNLGNISMSDTQEGEGWRPPWFEVDETSSDRNKFLHQEMLEGRAPRAFRSYPSLAAGAGDWARRMRTTFRAALDAAEGDTESFRLALSKGYSHEYADPASGKTLAALVKEFGGDSGQAPLIRSRSGGAVLLLAGVGISWYVIRHGRKRGASYQGKS